MTITPLDSAPIGPPITRSGISIYPVYLPGNVLPPIGTGRESGLTIDELPDAQVPHLVVHNPTDRPILIVEGEQFVGGRQNRTANASVLVPAGETREIPVSCLEVGRWGQHRAFEHAPTFTPRRVRRTKQREVVRSMAAAGVRSGDQQQVWQAIQVEMSSLAAPSSTGAVAEKSASRTSSSVSTASGSASQPRCPSRGISFAVGSRRIDDCACTPEATRRRRRTCRTVLKVAGRQIGSWDDIPILHQGSTEGGAQ